MIIFRNPKTNKHAIFIHMPHTGGSSTKQWLEENFDIIYEPKDSVEKRIGKSGYWHKPISFASHIDVNTCFKFGFIRNPLDWYATIWFKRRGMFHPLIPLMIFSIVWMIPNS